MAITPQTGTIDDPRQKDDDSFLKSVAPALQALEHIRLKKLKVYEWRIKIGTGLAIFLTPICAWLDWLLLVMQRGSDDHAAGITLAVLGALYTWVTSPKRQYAKAYKTEILPKIANLFGNLSYKSDGQIPMKDMEDSKIIPAHDHYESEDYFEGVYNGVNIKLSEIRLEKKRESGKRTYYDTVFKGMALLINHPMPKFNGHTILQEDSGKIAQWFTKKNLGLQRADLVDPEFEKMFDVYTNDQVEARYLIDPVMIETLKSMTVLYESDNFLAAYFKKRTLVLIPSKRNHFEPAGLRIPATDSSGVLYMKKELESILTLVDRLDLYDIGGHGKTTHKTEQPSRKPINVTESTDSPSSLSFLLPPD